MYNEFNDVSVDLKLMLGSILWEYLHPLLIEEPPYLVES